MGNYFFSNVSKDLKPTNK
jgi:Ca2+-binding EF-hand superfamily protein